MSLLPLLPRWKTTRRSVVALAALLFLNVCGREPTAPQAGTGGAEARLAFQPLMRPSDRALFQSATVAIDNVHLVLRAADGTVVLDTVVTYPGAQDTVAVTATVSVHGDSERFGARFALRNGTTTMFEGAQDVIARPGVNPPGPTVVPMTFVGPGARAARVVVSPGTSTLLAGASMTLAAAVRDSVDAPIAGAPLVWFSANPAIATVNSAGVVVAGTTRGSTTISASTLSGVAGSATVSVTLPPSRVVVTGGDGQSGRVGTALAQPFAVQVQASDGVGVAGVAVAFAALADGAAVGNASVTTDANGSASTTMTLGGGVGTQAFRATAPSLTPVTVNAIATVGLPGSLTVVSGDAQVDTIGRALAQPFVVRVTDGFGNPVPGAAVTWARTAGTGSASATTSLTNAQGQAQVSYTLGSVPGTETIVASVTTGGGGAATVTFTATARPRPASAIVVVSGDGQAGRVGEAAAQPLVVRVTDNLGNAVPNATVDWVIAGNGSLSARSNATDATGQARVSVTYGTVPGGLTVTAQLRGVAAAAVQFHLGATPGPAATLLVAAGDVQTAPAGSPVPIAPAVQVTDQYDNPLVGTAVTFTPSGGGSVSGSPAGTNVNGIATVGSWTLGATAGAQALVATSGTLSITITATATAPVGPPVLAIATQPSASVQNTVPFAQQPVIQLKTAGGANLATAGVVVTVVLAAPGPVLRGTLTATTNASGVATFTGLSVMGTLVTDALVFTATGYTSVTSNTFTMFAGPAATVAASTTTALTGAVNTVASPNPTVFVSDSSGNGVPGVTVTFATPGPGNGGLVTGGATITNTAGLTSPATWTFDTVPGQDTLTATVAGAAGSPVRFIATTTAGAATQLVKISGDGQTAVTGNPIPVPMVVEARDAFSNPVSGVSITFTTIAGGGTPASDVVGTDGLGRASFSLTVGPPGSDTVRACLPSCATAQVFFSALAIPVGADAIWTGATSTTWTTASNWSPGVVPTGANKVFIPGGTPFSAALTANQGVFDLTMASGATLNVATFELAIGGNLLATGAAMTGTTGYVYFCGGTHTYSGASATMVVSCGATVNAAGAGSVNGVLQTHNGSVFNVGTADVAVSGDVGMYSGSRIQMTTAGGHLTVNGNYDSNPGNDVGDGWMTNGVLELKGNLQALNNCCGQGFRAVGAHVTRFSGTGAQSISFYYAHEGYHRETFGNVEFTGTNTVTLNNHIRVHGLVTVTGTAAVAGSGKVIFHGGQLTTAAGTNLSGLGATQLNGGGAIFPLVAGTGPPEVQIAGGFTVTLPASAVTLPTTLTTHSGAVLDLTNRSLTVTGNYGMYSGSRVKMIDPAAHFTVNGLYDSNPGNDVGDLWMTDGVLELKGNLQALNNCCGQGFRAVGAHITRFSGTGAQSISFYYAHEGYHRETFGHVEFTGGNTVTLANHIRVHNTVTVTGTTTVTGSGKVIFHIGQLTTAAGTNLAGLGATQLNGGGAVFPLVAGTGPPEVQIAGGFTVTLPAASVTVPTTLTTHSGAVLDVEGKTLTVTGNYGVYSGSRPKMINAGAHFTVQGLADFNPGNDFGDTWLTDGLLELKGNLQTTNSCCGQGFRAVGSHITRFSGTGAQTISFYYAHEGYHRETFGHVEFTGGNTVTLANHIRVHNTVTVSNNTTVTGSGKVIFHIGQLTTTAGTNLSGIGATQLNGGGAVFPLVAGTAPPEVQIAGGFTVTLPQASVTLPTTLTTHSGAVLDVEGKTLTVTGNYGVYSGSRPKMINAAAHFTVQGDADFNAGDFGDGWLTDGLLELKGNLQALNNCCGQGFRAVGAHITRFSGSAAQTISFYYAHENFTRETFGHVEFTGGNTVTLGNHIRVWGTVNVSNNTTVTGSGKVIFHIGQLTTAAGTSLAGLGATQLNGGGAIFPLIAGAAPPEVQIAGGITVTLPASSVTLPTTLTTHSSAVLDLTNRSLTVTGNYGMYSSSRVKMIDPAAHFTVNGNYDSNPGNDVGDGWMTDGVLELKGNLQALNNCCGQGFRAVGAHITRFSGTGAQTISFYYAHEGYHRETFGHVEFTNASALGVTAVRSLRVFGNLTNTGRFTIGAGFTTYVTGAVSLGASSFTTNSGGFSFGSCSVTAGATISGFTCP